MTTVRHNRTHAQQTMRLNQIRQAEEQREDSLKNLGLEQMQIENMKCEDRAQNKRVIRRAMQEQKELEMLEAIEKAERDKLIREEQQEQEDRLAKKLQSLQHEKDRDEKMRQQIRECSNELRELESQLKAAYMNKERSAQLAEKEALKYDKMERDAEIAKLMQEEHQRAREAEVQKEKERYEAHVRYQQELERQLEEQQLKRQEEYEQYLKEKLMVDEISRKISMEDQKERERMSIKQDMLQKHIVEDKKMREEWKRMEKARLQAENAQIAKFAVLQKEREADRQEAKKEQEEFRAWVQQQLSEKIAKERQEMEEMEQVRQDLYMEEQEEQDRMKEQNLVRKREEQRRELQHVHAEQIRYKEMRRQAELDEEEEFKKQMLAKFAEDDRIEQMNAQKRRLKQQEHKRAVERLLEDRRSQFVSEKDKELEARREEEEMDRFRQQIIEEERARLLKEHAPKLVGYLPKGVIRNQKDLDHLGPELREAYSTRNADPFEDSSWHSKK